MVIRRIGKYEIVDRLGRGGTADVFRAFHPSLKRYVAIKMLHANLADDSEFKARFENEAGNVGQLRHPNIVQAYDFDLDTETETYYMVMELIEGPSLKEVLTELEIQRSLLPLHEVLRFIRQAASALDYAHSQGMIHRDVKPGNLMLDEAQNCRVVLTDFGIAKIVNRNQQTASGGMIGTPAYMAPEQAMGEAGDERSDLYSLGVILYQMVTGRLPFDADTPLGVALMHIGEVVPSPRQFNPELPSALERVVYKLLAKEPVDRYQKASELIADLEEIEKQDNLTYPNAVTVDAPAKIAGAVQKTLILNTENIAEALPIERTGRIVQTTQLVEEAFRRRAQTATDNEITNQKSEYIEAVPVRPARSVPLWFWLLSVVFLALVIVFIGLRDQWGMILGIEAPTSTPTPTFTATEDTRPTQTAEALLLVPTETATFTPTVTLSPTPTPTSTLTPTTRPSNTSTPTITPTVITNTPTVTLSPTTTPTTTLTPTETLVPTLTLTPTQDITLTLIQATHLLEIQTATIAACDFDYAIVEQSRIDGDFYEANRTYTREITLLNTGTCAWERLTSLTFIQGEDFDVGPRIFIPQRVSVGEAITLVFAGRTPVRGALYVGTWQLLTPGQIIIGDPIQISVNVFEGQ